jgi:hypothetical protein
VVKAVAAAIAEAQVLWNPVGDRREERGKSCHILKGMGSENLFLKIHDIPPDTHNRMPTLSS